eukprot:778408-Amphidinium_carterae.1
MDENKQQHRVEVLVFNKSSGSHKGPCDAKWLYTLAGLGRHQPLLKSRTPHKSSFKQTTWDWVSVNVDT